MSTEKLDEKDNKVDSKSTDRAESNAKDSTEVAERSLAEVRAQQEKSGAGSTPNSDANQAPSEAGKKLQEQGILGQLDIVDAVADAKRPRPEPRTEAETIEDVNDDDHVNVGKPITWSKATRDLSRPKDGEGYYQVMQAIGAELLGRPLKTDETMQLVAAAKALQAHRGKDPETLTGSDELLPKNQNELVVFMNNFGKDRRGRLTDTQVKELQKDVHEAILTHQSTDPKEVISFELKPVKDQKVVTDVVPNAVYIDNSHIEGGQGHRRKENCETETQPYWLSKNTAEALMRAQKCLVENGKDPLVLRNMNGAGRRALDRELIKKCAPNQPHAKRRSQHEFGISIDVDNYDNPDVRKAIEREGFVHNVPGDRPHFTYLRGPGAAPELQKK
ncbi:MAG: hypothetical protein K2X77_04035 [Candidatus Obscuribacterales bacterium]|nr:hypothetical protein [Candidatus Obscuribacterales bacterium]